MASKREPVEQLVDELALEGFRLVDRTDRRVILERRNPAHVWLFGLMMAVMSSWFNLTPRTQRIYLDVDEVGMAEVIWGPLPPLPIE